MKRKGAPVLVVLALVLLMFAIAPSHGQGSGIGGTVYWADQYGNLYSFSWVQVSATSEDGVMTVTSSTVDGGYALFVGPGTYNVTASSDPAFIPQSKTVVVPIGGVVAGVDFELQPSGKPIPEYPAPLVPVLLLLTMLAATMMIRRRRAD
jgi:hypothetical protein